MCERSLRFARETGYMRGRRMKVVLDTTYVLGRGAVKETYNLLSDGIVKLMRALSEVAERNLALVGDGQRIPEVHRHECEGGGLHRLGQQERSLGVGLATVERIRRRCVEEGIESALNRRKQLRRRQKSTGW